MDAILYWNDVALEANRISHTNDAKEQTGPALSSRALAIVHLAMYDAFAGAQGNPAGLPPYLAGLPAAAPNASPDAAVAGAAHTALSALFPSQRPFFDTKRSGAPLVGTASELSNGHMFGVTVAHAILADRECDDDAQDHGHVASTARGAHRPDPDNPRQGFDAPSYGARTKCFAVTKRWALDKPPLPGDVEYTDAFRQVRGKGIAPELAGTLPASLPKRTVDETLIGTYWAYDGARGIGTPPRLYNQIVGAVARQRNNSPAENARLFALVNAAMADAGILAWEQKYLHDLWRPVVGIREHDPSLGPSGMADNDISDLTQLDWLPLGAPRSNGDPKKFEKNFTPPFPAYPSGHATFGAAAFQMARLFYKQGAPGPDSLFNGLSFVSDEYNGVSTDVKGTVRPRHVRDFPGGLWRMIRENSISRMYLGVHWIFDGFLPDGSGGIDLTRNIGGVPLGLNIANDIFNSGLKKSKV